MRNVQSNISFKVINPDFLLAEKDWFLWAVNQQIWLTKRSGNWRWSSELRTAAVVNQGGCANADAARPGIVDGRFLKNGAVKSCGCLPRGVPQGEMPERAMAQPSVSLGRLRKSNDDPWRNLANAIVAVAADDYRSALRNEDEGLLKSLERFFHSEWYRILTDVDADRLLGMLRREQSGSLQAAYI